MINTLNQGRLSSSTSGLHQLPTQRVPPRWDISCVDAVKTDKEYSVDWKFVLLFSELEIWKRHFVLFWDTNFWWMSLKIF